MSLFAGAELSAEALQCAFSEVGCLDPIDGASTGVTKSFGVVTAACSLSAAGTAISFAFADEAPQPIVLIRFRFRYWKGRVSVERLFALLMAEGKIQRFYGDVCVERKRLSRAGRMR